MIYFMFAPFGKLQYHDFEQKKGFYNTPQNGSSIPGKLKDVCSHGKCQYDS